MPVDRSYRARDPKPAHNFWRRSGKKARQAYKTGFTPRVVTLRAHDTPFQLRLLHILSSYVRNEATPVGNPVLLSRRWTTLRNMQYSTHPIPWSRQELIKYFPCPWQFKLSTALVNIRVFPPSYCEVYKYSIYSDLLLDVTHIVASKTNREDALTSSWMVYLHSPRVFHNLMVLSRDPDTICL